MRKFYYLLLIISLSIAQISIDKSPASNFYNLSNSIHSIEMPDFDIDKMLLEDKHTPKGSPFRYGKIFDVDYSLNNSGSWEILDNGDKVWRLKIYSANAYSIGIKYDYFNLPEGAEFYVYNSNKENIFGAYSHLNNQEDYLFATPLVKGNEIILEYYEPDNVEFEGEIYLSEIIHDYRDIMNFFNNDNDRLCGTNTHGGNELCPEAEPYETVINATSWLDMGGWICSGSMLNNVRMDLTPYYMTAWHCTSGSNPSTFRFYFNYGAYSCSSGNGNPGVSAYGSQMLANSNGMDSDWSLLRINGNILESWEVFYAGWDRSTDNPIVSCAIHHPGGSPKRINFDDDMAYSSGWNNNQPTHWRVFWDDGGTEGGSSGCPLYDENFRFRGQLSGGPDVPCEGQGSYDLYGKFDRAWSSINQWLDPDNTGVMYIDGTYNGSLIVEGCTDPDAENYDPDATMDDGSCFYGIADLYFGDTGSDFIEIKMNNSSAVAGFQFTITDNLDLITLVGANGGSAEENGFQVSTSEIGIVIGFSMTGGAIPVGDELLTNLEFMHEGSGTTEVCITDQIVSDINGNAIETISNNCLSLELNEGTLGDINGDGGFNILDIVMLVNFILDEESPDGQDFYVSDLNGDGILNIQDVIILINLILAD